MPLLEKLPTRRNRAFDTAITRLRGLLDQIVAEYQQDDTERADLLSMLMNARDQDTGQPMPAHQLRNEVINVLAAGMETTADTLAWILHERGQHPEIDQRAHDEAAHVVGDLAVTLDDLPRLPYIQSVVKEALRIHPPTNLLMRKTVAPVDLNGVRIPVGTEVIVSPLLTHHDPNLFADPTRFDPDRWTREETASLPKGAYLPFGMGNRQCVGEAFALTEIPIVLATLLARWQLRPVPGHVVHPVQAVTVSPGRLPMTAVPRHVRTSSS
ncbi:cytochrome P450 [Kitasatospora sp. NPDC058046]|uniref:cytochrome P450 n=1 Tax=Kitasatospora sp. NPDC058046 TaxID=3346312 RepID=UPI0036DA21E4